MTPDIVLRISIIVIIVLCTLILLGLTIIYTKTKEWRILSLMLIPLAFETTYLWIGIFEPNLEIARNVIRTVITTCGCIALHVIYTYILRISRDKKQASAVNNVSDIHNLLS